ncbi:uncharacterized protein RSE6_12171 [Rhynchosporium secalis]|uniref:Uncharacterized protein n=1 Tax=Rhynchosporium secalis TaxID=38038 RepID=A0A1E1MPR3_RHYSE|nr:uncharacterized protein RSE6_12171 [Rhynchosporium secalis]
MYLESFEQRDLMLGMKDMNLFYEMLQTILKFNNSRPMTDLQRFYWLEIPLSAGYSFTLSPG